MGRLFLVATSLALLMLATPLLALAKEDPEALLKMAAEMDNAKDQQGLAALFAADGVVVAPSPEEPGGSKTYTGTDEIRQWIKMDVEGDGSDDRVELGTITVQGDTASAPFKVYTNDDQLKQAGLEPLLGTVELTAKDGKIARFVIALDPEWMKKVEAAFSAPGEPDPSTLPATGDASDPLPLPLALVIGLGLLGTGLALRLARRVV